MWDLLTGKPGASAPVHCSLTTSCFILAELETWMKRNNVLGPSGLLPSRWTSQKFVGRCRAGFSFINILCCEGHAHRTTHQSQVEIFRKWFYVWMLLEDCSSVQDTSQDVPGIIAAPQLPTILCACLVDLLKMVNRHRKIKWHLK